MSHIARGLLTLTWLSAGQGKALSVQFKRGSFRHCHTSEAPPPACLWFSGRSWSAAVGNAASGTWSPALESGGSAGSQPAWRKRWCCSVPWCHLHAGFPSSLPLRASGCPSPSSEHLWRKQNQDETKYWLKSEVMVNSSTGYTRLFFCMNVAVVKTKRNMAWPGSHFYDILVYYFDV